MGKDTVIYGMRVKVREVPVRQEHVWACILSQRRHLSSMSAFFPIHTQDKVKSRKENPSETDSIKFKISAKIPRGKKYSTKRHHHRHHKRQPGEQQFPIQVVIG